MKKIITIIAIALCLVSCSKDETETQNGTDFENALTNGTTKIWKVNACFAAANGFYATYKWTFKSDGTGSAVSGEDKNNFTWSYDQKLKILTYTYPTKTYNINKIYVMSFTADAIDVSKIEYYTNTALQGSNTSESAGCTIGFIKN